MIEGVGVMVGSSSVPSTYNADTVTQQPQGTVTIAVDVTFPSSSTACGVNIAKLVGLASPLTAIATPKMKQKKGKIKIANRSKALCAAVD